MKIIGGILILILCGVLVWIGWSGYCDWKSRDDRVPEYSTYEGRFILQQDEYSVFKRYLATFQEIEIVKLEVFTSPDALVDMELNVPANIDMPWGEKTFTLYEGDQWADSKLILYLSGAFIVFAGFVIYTLWFCWEGKEKSK